MKLVSFHVGSDPSVRTGCVLPGGRLLDLTAADSAFAGLDMTAIVRDHATLMPRAEASRAAAEAGRTPHAVWDESSTTLLAPIPRPPSMRDGYAFRQHVETARKNRGLGMIPEFDLFPVFYFTNHLAVTGGGDLRVGRERLDRLDFELECFVVVGKTVTNPTLEEADDAIFGYGVMNDWSARALQMEEMKLNLGPAKGKDFATGLGPWLVTKDELASRLEKTAKGNVLHARMTAEVNGVRVSDGNVDQMSFTFAQIVRRAADGVMLQPGEVIGSGTVGTGCFLELNGSKVTNDQWLKRGDTISLEIEGLGRLTNRIVEDPAK